MIIKRNQTGNKGKFYAEEDGDLLGELSYAVSSPDKMILEHTEVNKTIRRKGVGSRLVEHAVAYARANHFKIIPTCSFAKSIIGKRPEWQDLLFQPG
jgi:predicted GNAT family acetyltransferase